MKAGERTHLSHEIPAEALRFVEELRLCMVAKECRPPLLSSGPIRRARIESRGQPYFFAPGHATLLCDSPLRISDAIQ